MNNFIFQNTTKLVFGKGQISQLPNLLPKEKNIMLTFGGGSVKQNTVYDQVITALTGYKYIEFWGIESNPKIGTLTKAIQIGKENKIDFILAVGGGSVLDGTKLISAGIVSDENPWNLVLKGMSHNTIPIASVMTLPATGSEMNAGAVISNPDTEEKYSFYSKNPVFSILDPTTTFSLPKYQVSCGIADTFVHVMEQYLTTTNQSRLMDRWAESILLNLIEIAPKIMENQTNYDLMSDFMLCATMALNDFIRMGITQDWSTHMIGHELTALHNITHGETLTIILPAVMKVMKKQKADKILQYGERIWNIKETDKDIKIDKAIEKTEQFFKSINLATRLNEKNIGEETINKIVDKFNKKNTILGEGKNITGEIVLQILLTCR